MSSNVFRHLPYFGYGTWQAPVPTVGDLPMQGSDVGDTIVIQSTQDIYVWNGSSWVLVAGPSGIGQGINSLNGLTIDTQFFATGVTGSDFNISSVGATHTFNIPNAGIGTRGLITNIAQQIDGTKTFLTAPIISPFNTPGIVHNDINGLLYTSLIFNADVAVGAALDYSKLNLTNSIVNGDISSLAAIARTKIAAGSPNQVIINDGSGLFSSEAQLALSRGGTNNNITPNAGALAYSTATNISLTAPGTVNYILQSNGTAAPSWINPSSITGIDHGSLVGLADDDHLQYALLLGRLGGQILIGGTQTSDNLILRSTSNAAKGQVYLDETTVSTSITTGALRIAGGAAVQESLSIGNDLRIVKEDNYTVEQYTVTTTDDIEVNLALLAIPTDSTQLIEARITAFRTSGSGTNADSANYIRHCKAKNNAGSVSVLSVQTSFTSEDVAGWNATIDASGTNARIRVSGALLTTIVWRATIIKQVNAG